MPFTLKRIAMRLRNDSEYIPLPGVRGDAGPAGPGVPAGGTTGQVLAKASNADNDTEWVNQSGGSAEMTILSYGNSTWADFIAAYRENSIVYCRASISTDPSAGSQVRMAAMAYVNHPTVPTSVDFVYYYPATHSDSQQGDQVFVYTLTNANGGTWSFAKKEAYTKIAAGTNMTSSYANGTLTLNATGGGGGTLDYDDLTDKPSINGTTLSGNKTAAELGLGTYSKPSGGISASDLASAVQTSLGKADTALQSVPATYRTAAAQDSIDATQDAAIGVVITGNRPSMVVAEGQYVIVRNSTISGITDGLYTANAALSPSTDVTAADLTAVNDGGLNSLGAYVDNNFAPYNQIMVTGYSTYKMTLPSLSGHFVFIVGSALSRSAILYIVVQNSGVVAVEEIQKGTNFTYTIGTNELTFGNGATYAIYIKEIPIRGDPITVEPVS